MPSIDERLEAIAHNLELVSQMQLRTEQVVNILAEDQAKTERIMAGLAEDQAKTERVMARIAVLVRDHEERLQKLER